MSAEIINFSTWQRQTEPSRVYLEALDQLRVLREAAVKLGWVLPKDPNQAAIQFTVRVFC